ncbi:glycerate kinase [Staphylococcus sp. IVB6246]|uniref:glycerate kinase family protein n=1 Tax=unclassified Staphylococcus TaxID=91994 RepID=UPI0021D13207|nr:MULTISPECIES: glycerate kinase [unclassified Staphylococcus]UXR69220.1 glycerate kinase [Staphylococcus sp. IVB6246]UXR71276.1 glycerate kinase [Staphylococcus sp. IVB6240]UXR73551.1 glycerate kinase [Staphylococcus sp. IVB6238]
MNIVVIPSGFKESLSAEEVGMAIHKGIDKVDHTHDVTVIPMVDGGEGFAKTIVKLKSGEIIHHAVTGPIGEKIDAYYGMFYEDGLQTAVIEMAVIAGLKNVPKHLRNPMKTTTYGVGEMILKAVEDGAERILIGCGDSGTNDGGIGMAQALGVRCLDASGHPIKIVGGGEIHLIHQLDYSGLNEEVIHTPIDVAVNRDNVLCGESGVAKVYGPQKGATPEQVVLLSHNLEYLADLYGEISKEDLKYGQGTGASGGLGAGLVAICGARLHPRFEIIMKYIQISDAIQNADLVFTAEGCLDYQTPHGKIPSEVARIAKLYHKPVIALAGTIGKDAKINYDNGIDAYVSIIPQPATLEDAMMDASRWLKNCAENAMRKVMIGIIIGKAMKSHVV